MEKTVMNIRNKIIVLKGCDINIAKRIGSATKKVVVLLEEGQTLKTVSNKMATRILNAIKRKHVNPSNQ